MALAFAASGEARAASVYDQDFGSRGRVVSNMAMNDVPREGFVQGMNALPDGRFTVTFKGDWQLDKLKVLRFRADGDPDRSFGDGGVLEPGFGSISVPLPGGETLVGGEIGSGTPGQDIALRRYKQDGSLDRGFGRKGLFRFDFGAQDTLNQMVVTADGRIAIQANVFCHATQRICYDSTSDSDVLALLSGNGRLIRKASSPPASNGFGGITAADDGSLRAVFDNGPDVDVKRYRFVRIDRKLRVTTIRDLGSDPAWAGMKMLPGNAFYSFGENSMWSADLVKVKPGGELDPGFGTDGQAVCPVAATIGNPYEHQMAIDDDGRILVRGLSKECPMFRVLPSGQIDTSFGTDGVADLPGDEDVPLTWSIAPTRDGKVILARWDHESGHLIIQRLAENGSVDQGFGVTDLPVPQASADVAKAIVPVGKGVLVAGNSNCTGLPPATYKCVGFALAKLKANGSPDHHFGHAGKVTGNFMSVRAVAREGDGSFVIAGAKSPLSRSAGDSDPGFALARFSAAGRQDLSFGEDGVAQTRFADNIEQAAVNAIAIQRDGKILVTGEAISKRGGVAAYLPVARYQSDGSPDETFGSGGVKKLQLKGLELGSAIKSLANGQILVSGRSGPNAIVLRLKPNGTLDRAFGRGGVATPKLQARPRFGGQKVHYTPERSATSLLILPNGSLLAGAADGYGMQDGAVFMLKPNGRVDHHFGQAGVAYTGGLAPGALTAVKCGRVFVSGVYRKGFRSPRRFGVTRLRAGGAADRAFNRGRTVLPFGKTQPSWATAAARSQGRVVVAGAKDRAFTNEDFALAGFKGQKKCR